MQITFQTLAQYGRAGPEVKINDTVFKLAEGISEWSIDIDDIGLLEINFFNKAENDTIVEHGIITSDSEFKILKVWVDGIVTELWFLNQMCYRPQYFQGFLDQFPDSPKEVVAPFKFNFPGTIRWEWEGSFWDWYFNEHSKREVIHFLDKDPDRVWKFKGSLDDCQDIIHKIKNVLKL